MVVASGRTGRVFGPTTFLLAKRVHMRILNSYMHESKSSKPNCLGTRLSITDTKNSMAIPYTGTKPVLPAASLRR